VTDNEDDEPACLEWKETMVRETGSHGEADEVSQEVDSTASSHTQSHRVLVIFDFLRACYTAWKNRCCFIT